MKIVITKIQTAIKSLEIYSRIFMGQYDHLNWEIRLNAIFDKANWKDVERKEDARKTYLREIRDLVFPDLADYDFYASRGIWNEKNDPRAIDAYDMQQTIRYVDSWFRVPEGGIGRNFDVPWIRGRFPEVKAVIVGNKDDYCMKIELLPEQFEILKEAAAVYLYLNQGEMLKLFSVYTNNPKALEIAKDLKQFNVPPYEEIINDAADYLEELKKYEERN